LKVQQGKRKVKVQQERRKPKVQQDRRKPEVQQDRRKPKDEATLLIGLIFERLRLVINKSST